MKLDSYLADICINPECFFRDIAGQKENPQDFSSLLVSFWVTPYASNLMFLIPFPVSVRFEGVIPIFMLQFQKMLYSTWQLCEDVLAGQGNHQRYLCEQPESLCKGSRDPHVQFLLLLSFTVSDTARPCKDQEAPCLQRHTSFLLRAGGAKDLSLLSHSSLGLQLIFSFTQS